jgi:hypothetical protein
MTMFHHVRPRAVFATAVVVAALAVVPAASSGNYADPSGDNVGGAGDITSVTVAGDKGTGQLVFRVAGSNLASSQQNVLFVDIDADANPATGNPITGAEYSFYVDDSSYDFARWNGSDWVDPPSSTVRVSGNTSVNTISVNRSELGNTSDFNFEASSLLVDVSTSNPQLGVDFAPDDGMYNYSLDANGPQIDSVDVQTTPAAPRAGKRFAVAPTALHLPPDGRSKPAAIVPESYSCSAKLGAKKLAGSGTGGCTFSIPKKKAKGKTLAVQLTVSYQGATKVVPLTYKVR